MRGGPGLGNASHSITQDTGWVLAQGRTNGNDPAWPATEGALELQQPRQRSPIGRPAQWPVAYLLGVCSEGQDHGGEQVVVRRRSQEPTPQISSQRSRGGPRPSSRGGCRSSQDSHLEE